MSRRKITIRMPKKLLADWLATLRSGEVKQGRGQLFVGNGYCCLGVLQCIATGGKVEAHSDGSFFGLPSPEWLRGAGIQFLSETGGTDNAPYLPTIRGHAASANDGGMSFVKIADAIERHAEGY